jgi:DNA topoisomerase-1
MRSSTAQSPTFAPAHAFSPSRRAKMAHASTANTIATPPVTDPVQAAKAAALRYVSDEKPGIRRLGSGKRARYVDADGKPVRDAETLARIRSLVIPPAWTDVWVCPLANGHLQATGRDARARKQYRYHPRWREVRDQTKYERMLAFASVLPKVRKRVEHDLSLHGLPRDKVLATIVRLLETTLIRVGNEEYARTNHSFGLTTMRDQHVDVSGSKVEFKFRGKSGKWHQITLSDRRLAQIVQRCRDVPGYELFQYIDEAGNHQSLDSADVNEYLRAITGQDFTAKDFRTWAGTVLAALALQEFEKFDSQTQAKRNLVQAIEHVAERLGNTPTVCRKCYIHPEVIAAYLDGTLANTLKLRAERAIAKSLAKLKPEEAAVVALLQQRLAQEVKASRKKGATNGALANGKKPAADKKMRKAMTT